MCGIVWMVFSFDLGTVFLHTVQPEDVAMHTIYPRWTVIMLLIAIILEFYKNKDGVKLQCYNTWLAFLHILITCSERVLCGNPSVISLIKSWAVWNWSENLSVVPQNVKFTLQSVRIAFMLAHIQNNSLGPEGPSDTHGAPTTTTTTNTCTLSRCDGPTTLQWFIHKIFYPATTPNPTFTEMWELRCEAESFRYTWAAAHHFKQFLRSVFSCSEMLLFSPKNKTQIWFRRKYYRELSTVQS